MKAAINFRLKRRFTGDSEDSAREIEEEFRFHLEMLTQGFVEQKMSSSEAEDAARRQFGNVEQS